MKEALRELGLNDNEINVYLSLADIGRSSAGLLAKRTSLPRTTAYSVLENLAAKGLVSSEDNDKTAAYVANSPSALLRMVEREQATISNRMDLAQELISQLGPYFKSRNFSVPKMQFYDGAKNVEAMLYQSLDIWRKSIYATDYTWWGYQDHSVVENYRGWLESTWVSLHPKENINLVSNPSPIEDELSEKVKGRNIRFLPDGTDFSSSIWVAGHHIIMIFSREKPHYAFQIRDAVFAANLRSVFKVLWHFCGGRPLS